MSLYCERSSSLNSLWQDGMSPMPTPSKLHFFRAFLMGFLSSNLAWMCYTQCYFAACQFNLTQNEGKQTWTRRLIATKLSDPRGMMTSAYFFVCTGVHAQVGPNFHKTCIANRHTGKMYSSNEGFTNFSYCLRTPITSRPRWLISRITGQARENI